MRGQSRHNTARMPIIATQFPGHGSMDDLTTKRSFHSQATWAVDVLGLFFRHVIHGCLYAGRHPELNICIVLYMPLGLIARLFIHNQFILFGH